jgi:hypothetical protein
LKKKSTLSLNQMTFKIVFGIKLHFLLIGLK